MPNPYDRTTHDGNTVDWLTKAALLECERRLGYELTITQGSYNAGGVSASAGTHDGGGVVDLAPWDYVNKVRVLRSVGFAAWYRPAISGLWPAHIHAVLIGNAKLAPVAARQVDSYRAGRDGLKSNAVDNTWRPSPIPMFAFPKPEPVKPKPAPVEPITLGCHNLHDEAGVPTLFADVLFFTEAIAPTIRARVKRRVARTKVALAGYRVVSAPENRTIVVAVKRRLFKVTGKEWHRAHGGKAGLTPARGTLLVRGVMRETGQPVSFLAEHRINDSWKTDARELPLRRDYWRKHTDLTKRLAEREIAAGRTVFAGGDMNTTKAMSAYKGVLEESGEHLDRLGVSPDMHISKAEVLSRRGSDHPRVRATVTPR